MSIAGFSHSTATSKGSRSKQLWGFVMNLPWNNLRRFATRDAFDWWVHTEKNFKDMFKCCQINLAIPLLACYSPARRIPTLTSFSWLDATKRCPYFRSWCRFSWGIPNHSSVSRLWSRSERKLKIWRSQLPFGDFCCNALLLSTQMLSVCWSDVFFHNFVRWNWNALLDCRQI